MSTTKVRKIPDQDFKSDYYVQRKPSLVTFLAQDHPIGTKRGAKLKEVVTSKASKLVNREVDIDMKFLDEHFREQCHKPPKIVRLVNHTHDEIREYMETIDGETYDAFFFFYLSYLSIKERKKNGNLPCLKVECYDKAVPIEEFMGMVKERPDMALKPKVFVFQADDRDLLQPLIIKKGDPSGKLAVFRQVTIPTDADQLMVLSTLPQLLPTLKKTSNVALSTASEEGGIVGQPSEEAEDVAVEKKHSLLIRAFVDVLKANTDMDVLSCTPLINGKVVEMISSLDLGTEYGEEWVQNLTVPLFYSTLTKQLKFYEERDFPFGL